MSFVAGAFVLLGVFCAGRGHRQEDPSLTAYGTMLSLIGLALAGIAWRV